MLLDDERVLAIPVKDSHEKMVSLRGIHRNIKVDESRDRVTNESDYFCYVRESVAARLKQAADHLPEGCRLLIKEAYRPLSQQRRTFERHFGEYKALYPDKSDDELYHITCQFVSPVESAGHPTGGAVDLTIAQDGVELDMGTVLNETPLPPENRTYLDCPFLSKEAKANRAKLIAVMKEAGFVNYPTEWWHWSYGDRYWGFMNHCEALYAPLEETNMPL